jgi:hypothetical protein
MGVDMEAKAREVEEDVFAKALAAAMVVRRSK